MPEDAYIRVGERLPRRFSTGRRWPVSLAFVDLELATGERPLEKLEVLRETYPSLAHEAQYVLIRSTHAAGEWDESRIKELKRSLADIDITCSAGFLEQRPGSPARLAGDLPPADGDQLLARARAVELRALLHWGGAIRRGDGHHYQLPSGAHSKIFVRTGAAIRSPHDAEVIASWMYPRIRPGLGLLTDTGTLSPVLSALHRAMERDGIEPGSCAVLDRYPDTPLGIPRAMERFEGEDGPILAILSVSSTGNLLTRVQQAFASHTADGTIEILVNREGGNLRAESGVKITSWVTPEHDPDLIEPLRRPGSCTLCRSVETALLVPVDPASFELMLPDEPARLIPDYATLSSGRRLWEWASENDAVLVDQKDVGSNIGESKLPVAVDPRDIDRVLGERAGQRIRRKLDLKAREGRVTGKASLALRQIDVLVVHEEDQELDRFKDFAEAFTASLEGEQRLAVYSDSSGWRNDATSVITAAHQPAVMTFGAISGKQIQGLLFATRTLLESNDHAPRIPGLIVHARPEDRRDWRTLTNAFDGLVFTAWLSFLPIFHSPLDDERQVLHGFQARAATLSTEGRRFFEMRRQLCGDPARSRSPAKRGHAAADGEPSPGDVPQIPLFWGGTTDDRLTARALPGDRLGALATYAAIGAAMQAARAEADLAFRPGVRRFDLPLMLKSYFDGLILCSFLRWLRPGEQWWGATEAEQEALLTFVLGRLGAESRYRYVFVCECLLAAALGKLPRQLAEKLLEEARELLEGDLSEAGPDVPGALELGIALVEAFAAADRGFVPGRVEAWYDEGIDAISIRLGSGEGLRDGPAVHDRAHVSLVDDRPVNIEVQKHASGMKEPLWAVSKRYDIDYEQLLSAASAAISVPGTKISLEVHSDE